MVSDKVRNSSCCPCPHLITAPGHPVCHDIPCEQVIFCVFLKAPFETRAEQKWGISEISTRHILMQ